MFIEAGAKPVNKGNYTGVQGRLVHISRTRAVVLQSFAMTRKKMHITMLSTAPSRCMK